MEHKEDKRRVEGDLFFYFEICLYPTENQKQEINIKNPSETHANW